MNLTELLKRPESKILEFKRDLSSIEGVLRTIVAFANTSGGILLIGVDDETRNVRGIHDPLRTQEQLANVLSDNILPRLVPELEILPWRRTYVLAAQVHAGASRPHYLKKQGLQRGTYVRVGASNRQADRELVAELKRFVSGESYDEQPLPDLDSEAIDFRAASECFAIKRKLKRSDLTTLRLVTRHQGRLVPTVGGMLLFGRERERYFPDAWIQAGRFDGIDKVHVSDSLTIRSRLPQAVDLAIAFVQKHDRRALRIGRVRHSEHWGFPPTAVREAVINAVVHADYSQRGAPIRLAFFDDRLEIENPGLLPFGLTIEDMREGISRLRNRVIGRVFQELGFIEQWGSGIKRMAAACRDAGLDEPDLQEVGTRFRVILRRSSGTTSRAGDKTDRMILTALSAGEGMTTTEIAARISRTPRATRTRLLALLARGLVREVASSLQDPKRQYFLA
jgi:ATP-dependent DNA helicase RecG